MNKILKIFSFWIVFGLWFMIVVWISYLIIKATRSSTNPWSDASPNDLYVSNGETLKASKRNSLVDKSLACPTGFTALSQNGSMLGCLQTTNSSWKSCPDAIQDCRTNYWGRLPTYSELYIWFKNSLVTIWNNNREWTDDAGYYFQWVGTQVCWLINKTSPFAPSSGTYNTTPYSYRCFIPR